jgi:hypothetical protein
LSQRRALWQLETDRRHGCIVSRRRLLALALAAGLAQMARAEARADVGVLFHAGWSIVAGPAGTRFAGASGPLYALGPDDDGYQALPAGTAATAGAGYWAYFPLGRTLQLDVGEPRVELDLPAATWVLIGNPSGALTLPVLGADAVFTFDPLLGYRYTGQLLPGQGGWAISLAGGAITIGV